MKTKQKTQRGNNVSDLQHQFNLAYRACDKMMLFAICCRWLSEQGIENEYFQFIEMERIAKVYKSQKEKK